MKTLYRILFLQLICVFSASAQWNTSISPHIYYNSGNVGIGTPASSTELLTVKRSTDGNAAAFNGPNSGLTIQPNTSSVDLVGYTAVSGYKSINLRSGASGLLINPSGNIGIGTNSPVAKLDINGNGGNVLNSTNKIIDANNQDMLSIRSESKTSVLNLVSSRSDAGALGGLVFTTTNGWMDSHANIAGIVGGRVGTEPYAGGYLSFWTKDGGGDIPRENMRISYNGNVGIGTTIPAFKLDVEAPAVRIKNSSTSLDSYTSFRLQGPDYVNGLEIDVFGNNNINNNISWSYGGGAGSASIVNVNAKPLVLGTSNQGRLLIDAAGNVGIGTNAPDTKLAVKGTVHAQEVKVDLNVPGPDYVFEENYNLSSLKEIETYIKQNKHLPEVPSAKEMETNGINLSEMNMLLLKKVEELTLHLIEKEKRMEKLEKRIEQLEKQK